MAKYVIDLVKIPDGAQSVLIDYSPGIYGGGPWTKIAEVTEAVTTHEVVHARQIMMRARCRDGDGLLHDRGAKYAVLLAIRDIDTKDDPPAPSTIPAGPKEAHVEVTVETDDDTDDTEHQVELAVSDTSTSNARDATPVDTFDVPGEHRVPMCNGATAQRVWARLVRREDGKPGAWASQDIDLIDPNDHHKVEDFATDFAGSGTIDQVHGVDTLKIASGDLRLNDVPGIDSTAIPINSSLPIDLEDTFNEGVFQADSQTWTDVVDFVPQLCPEYASLVRDAIGINSHLQLRPGRTQEIEDDEAFAKLPRDLTIGATPDRSQPQLDQEISVTQNGGSTWGSWTTWRAGMHAVGNGFRARLRLKRLLSHRGECVVDSWKVWRRRRNRKWEWVPPWVYPTEDGLFEYTFADPVPAVMDTSTLVATFDVLEDTLTDAEYSLVLESLTSTVIKIRCVMTVRESKTLDGSGALTWTYPTAFETGTNPLVTVGGGGPVEFNGTPGATSAALQNGSASETVHLVARGIAPVTDRKMLIHLMGA